MSSHASFPTNLPPRTGADAAKCVHSILGGEAESTSLPKLVDVCVVFLARKEEVHVCIFR